MRFQTLICCFIVGYLLSAEVARAQEAPPPPPPTQLQPPLPPGPALQPPPPPVDGPAVSVSGRVTRLLTNPNGDVDGLLLDQGMQVQMPPHLSSALQQSIHAGDTVNVQGSSNTGVPVVRASVISDRSSGQTVTDVPPAVPPSPATSALSPLTATGQVAHLLFTDRGDFNGAILDDGSIVHWPPRIGAQLRGGVTMGVRVQASGYGTQNVLGRSLEASALSVEGKPAFSVLGGPVPR